MTKRFSFLNWRDELYNAVRKAPGGIVAAASFLTERRDTSIHPESLRRKLTGGEQLDLDMAFLLTEWLQDFACSQSSAKDWLICAADQVGLSVIDLPPETEGGFDDEVSEINRKVLQAISDFGDMCSSVVGATEGGDIEELEAAVESARELSVLCLRMARNMTRWHSKEGGARG